MIYNVNSQGPCVVVFKYARTEKPYLKSNHSTMKFCEEFTSIPREPKVFPWWFNFRAIDLVGLILKGPWTHSTLWLNTSLQTSAVHQPSPLFLLSRHGTCHLDQTLAMIPISVFSIMITKQHRTFYFFPGQSSVHSTCHSDSGLSATQYPIHPFSRLRFKEHNFHSIPLSSVTFNDSLFSGLTNWDSYFSS